MVTKITDIDLASDVKWDVINNPDVDVPDPALKTKILSTSNTDLLRIVKTIGSHKKIIEADVVDEAFLTANLLSE